MRRHDVYICHPGNTKKNGKHGGKKSPTKRPHQHKPKNCYKRKK